MQKLVKILLFDSTAGRGFAYGKGENDVPEDQARKFVSEGIARYIDQPKTAQAPHQTAEKATNPKAKTAEKRTQ